MQVHSLRECYRLQKFGQGGGQGLQWQFQTGGAIALDAHYRSTRPQPYAAAEHFLELYGRRCNCEVIANRGGNLKPGLLEASLGGCQRFPRR
jgi:hypothetical protein